MDVYGERIDVLPVCCLCSGRWVFGASCHACVGSEGAVEDGAGAGGRGEKTGSNNVSERGEGRDKATEDHMCPDKRGTFIRCTTAPMPPAAPHAPRSPPCSPTPRPLGLTGFAVHDSHSRARGVCLSGWLIFSETSRTPWQRQCADSREGEVHAGGREAGIGVSPHEHTPSLFVSPPPHFWLNLSNFLCRCMDLTSRAVTRCLPCSCLAPPRLRQPPAPSPGSPLAVCAIWRIQ